MMTRNPSKRFLELLKYKIIFNYHVSANVFRNVFPNSLKKEKSNGYSSYSYSGIQLIERNLSHGHGDIFVFSN